MIIKLENSEESYAVNATTVLDSWEMMWKELKERSIILKKLEYNKQEGERNWEKGMKWAKVISSLKRHLAKIELGEDFDTESGMLHADHLQANAHFLAAYYRIYPQGDDRIKFFNKRVAIDLDGVLANFDKSIRKALAIPRTADAWMYSYKFANNEEYKKIVSDKDFWLNIEPYFDGKDLPFEPIAYVTHRPIPTEWCEEWIEKNNFPCAPVYVVSGSKLDVLKQIDPDIFIDDKYETFAELNNNGVFTYLYDQEWNRRYDVGFRRIKDLKEVIKRDYECK